MDALFNFIGEIFGYVLMFFNNIFGNFGVAIIAFTVFTRLLMFPLTINQQKSMAGMQRLQPKMKKICITHSWRFSLTRMIPLLQKKQKLKAFRWSGLKQRKNLRSTK